MPDREKVDKGLACCQYSSKSHCDGCPYVYDGLCSTNYCTADLASDVLILLKEQEVVDKNSGKWKNGHCSRCGKDVSSMLDTWTNVQSFLFCPNCGAKMEE